MTFGLLVRGSNDDNAIKQILVSPEVWNSQCRDGDKLEAVPAASFGEATFAAVFCEGGHPVGYFLFTPLSADLYVQHSAFLESHRGQVVIDCARAAHERLFCETPVLNIISHCPDWLPATKVVGQKMGGLKMSHMNNFAMREGRMQGATIYRLSAFDWACNNHERFERHGEVWHHQVFEHIEQHHDEDPAHNGFLGLALEMAKYQPYKAMAIYNMWAERAGYQQGEILWADGRGHSLIDFREGVCLQSPHGVLSVIPRCQPLPPLQPQLPQ